MNERSRPRDGGGRGSIRRQPAAARGARTGSLTRRMIGVAALWIAALLLIGGFALDRVLSRSIVDSFDNQLVYRPQLDDRLVRDRTRRRGPLQPPARRPALRRALFGPLFPDQRRGRRDLPVALAVGPPAARRSTATSTSSRTSTTATNSRPRPRRAAAHRRARRRSCPDRRSAGASRSRSRASRIDEQIQRLRSTLSGASARSASGCSCSPRCRPSTGCGRCAACAARSPRSARATRRAIGARLPAEIRPLTEEINQLLAHSEDAGGGSAAPRRQPRPCAEDAADRDHQRRDRARARPRRHRDAAKRR